MRSFHFFPLCTFFASEWIDVWIRSCLHQRARFICIICIQHESSSGESVLQSFCRQPVLTCCSHLKHVETTCEWIYKLGCCQNRAFFCGLFWVISHTHTPTHTEYVYCIAVGSCTAILLDTWRNMGEHIVFILFFPYHYLFVDRSFMINVGQHLELLMYGIPWMSSNISFIFGGVAMLYQFPPKVLKPSEELGLPVAPRREAANSLRITEVFFWGGGGQPRSVTVLVLVLGFFVFLLGLRILGVGVRTGGCWMLLGSGLMSPAQGWEIWALKSPKP